ncbi:MAG TPA: nuclear transport factor 2 family protein [Lacunisphaera sp.]|jgi:uncharacterized protein (TIGR02246 family)
METDEVRKLIEQWAASVRVHNLDGVLKDHASDLLMFDVIGQVRLNGLEEYRRTWVEQFFPWHRGTGRFDLVDLRITAGIDVAFATALIECAGTEEGKKVGFTLRLTIGLEKRAGRWTVVHEHHSEPIDFDLSRIDA